MPAILDRIYEALATVGIALPAGAATAANQTDGSQKSQVVDGAGNVIGSTGNAMDVNVKSDGAGLATSANQEQNSGRKTLSGALTNNTGTDEQTFNLGTGLEQWELIAIAFSRSAGTAATYQIRIGNTTGWTLGDMQTQRYDSGVIAVGTVVDYVFAEPVPIDTDANGNAYWETGFDAGADNDATWHAVFRKLSIQT